MKQAESREPIGDDAEPRALLILALRSLCDPDVRNALAAAVTAPGRDWAAVCSLAESERVAPLLYQAVRDLPGLPDAAAAQLAEAYATNAHRNQFYLEELGRIIAALDAVGIRVLVLKGAALAETLYSNRALRRMADIDLLVHRRDLAGAGDVLAALGFATGRVDLRPTGAEFENQRLFRKEGPVRVRVELHWSLFDSPYYQHALPMEWFWETAEPATIAGRRVAMLGPAAQVLHLCGHLRLHHSGTELRWLHDIALLVARQGARIDWNLVFERATQFDLVLPLRDVFSRVAAGWGAVPAPVLQSVQGLEPSRREARIFRWLTEPDRSVARRLWIDLATLPGWSPRLAFAWTNLVPSAAYMQQRYGIRHPLLVPLYYPYRWLRALHGARRPP